MTPTALLAAWLLNAIVAWAPVSVHRYTHVSDEETMVRYQSIAYDMAVVAMEEEPVFSSAGGRAETALLALSIASFESGQFRADIDTTEFTGDSRGGIKHAKCLAQIWPRQGELKIETRQDCFRVEIARIRESMAACPQLPMPQRLSVYASGSCDEGLRESELRMNRASTYWAAHRFMEAVKEIPESEASR